MSDAIAIDNPAATQSQDASPWRERFESFEGWLASLSDWMNPILVKETRQALKSRQFGLMFVLLLILCWVITIGGVTISGPGIYYSAAGGSLLTGYYIVLVFPLVVIVPFTAFRSLSSEREENTYDLLRVSTLSPHQIVRGKLGSAIVQDSVYLSAVAPCIAFTYLLRGVDVLTIALLLLFATLGSLALSMLGLFLAALGSRKQGQVLLSVVFVALLLLCLFGAVGSTIDFLGWGGGSFYDEYLWVRLAAMLSMYVTTFALIYLATVGLISYRSENRSTPLRWAMVVQQAVFIGWMSLVWLENAYDDDIVLALFFFAVGYWYFMGTMLSTESPELSHRVRRRLPQSTLARMLFGLYNPGPGTGYFFALANLIAVAVLGSAGMFAVEYWRLSSRTNNDPVAVALVMVIFTSMVAIYLGVGKLLVGLVRRFMAVPVVAGFLIHVFLVLAGSGIPVAIQLSIRSTRYLGYNAMQWLNPYWTFEELVDRGTYVDDQLYLQAFTLAGLATCVVVLNLPSIARELMQGRVALPTRLEQDEAELHPVEVKPQNPWDED